MEIKEVLNDKIIHNHIRMATNRPINGNENTPFETYGFALMVCGKPGSGKSSTVFAQLLNRHGLFYKKFERVYIFSPSLNTMEREIKLSPDKIFETYDIEALTNIYQEQKFNNPDQEEALIIIDDMLTEVMADKSAVLQKIIFNRRHAYISLIFLTQVFNKVPLKFRKTFSDFILFNTSNRKEVASFFEELTQYNPSEYKVIAKTLWRDQHDFIMINVYKDKIFRNFNRVYITIADSDMDTMDSDLSD